jgi:hypothetical protein
VAVGGACDPLLRHRFHRHDAYGEPRFTNDIDIVVRLNEADPPRLVEAFPQSDFYLSPESMTRALRRRTSFNLIHPSSGLKVDFMVAAQTPFNDSRFRRVRKVETGVGEPVPFASPEDVILEELEFFREGGSSKHLRDIAGVLKTSESIDRGYIDVRARDLDAAEEWRRAQEHAGV